MRPQRPVQPIELPNLTRIARSEPSEDLGQGGTRGVGARGFFLEDHIDGRARQRIRLPRRRLIVRRDSRAAQQTRRYVLDDLSIIPAP